MDLARLTAQAAAGDLVARDELVCRFLPDVRELVHRELASDFRRQHRWILPLFSTGDVVQEVLLSVVTSLDRFEGDDDSAFTRFLVTLVKHRLVDAIRHHEAGCRDVRRNAARGGEEGADDFAAVADPTPSLAASLGEQVGIFRDVLTSFDLRERTLLELRLVDELQFSELAQRLGYGSEDSARKAFRAAQARLLVRLRARGLESPGSASPAERESDQESDRERDR